MDRTQRFRIHKSPSPAPRTADLTLELTHRIDLRVARPHSEQPEDALLGAAQLAHELHRVAGLLESRWGGLEHFASTHPQINPRELLQVLNQDPPPVLIRAQLLQEPGHPKSLATDRWLSFLWGIGLTEEDAIHDLQRTLDQLLY